ncbi:secretion system chaperone SseA [Yokenella regensburgei]|jgi:secretion system chaperone SseA|uniref:Secretion system chaperone SseA n=2 Tax=Yokenella regensburgei TaxID=158877 RepID=A0ABX9S0L3_9ENTR|nr:secretion system chaperone SseA [Yokenella regensburgei]VFS19146.1 Secretion system effector A [Yokenella regensburgei]
MMKTNIAAEQKRMEREYSRLCQCYANFTRLKLTMAELVARAATDPAAAKKLNDLQALMPQGIAGLERQAGKDMQALNVALKQLQSRLKNMVNDQ